MRRPPPGLTALCLALCAAATIASASGTSASAQSAGVPAAPTPVAAEPAACDRVASNGGLTFSDDDAFEQRLASAMTGRPETLTVTVARPFSPETIPDRAHAWLVETARQGGSVRRRDIPCGGRNGAASVVDFGMRAFLARPGDQVAAAVRGYDAVLWVEQATGAVTQIQFLKRGA